MCGSDTPEYGYRSLIFRALCVRRSADKDVHATTSLIEFHFTELSRRYGFVGFPALYSVVPSIRDEKKGAEERRPSARARASWQSRSSDQTSAPAGGGAGAPSTCLTAPREAPLLFIFANAFERLSHPLCIKIVQIKV